MASVDWKKATTQYAGAMKKHNGKDERVNGNHSNTDIDKSKSHLNVFIGADDYAPMLEKVKARIKEVDRKYPPKRNMGDKRITCIMLETPVPQEITEQGKAAEFLRSAHKVIEDFFGTENVGGTCGHFDEQHWYIDKDGKERLSLVHGHTIVAAYAEWTDKKSGEQRIGINGKNCETKARLNALNKAINDMCVREYGINYNTAEIPQRKSVETLKRESEVREEIGELNKQLEELQQANNESQTALQKSKEKAWETWAKSKMMAYDLYEKEFWNIMIKVNDIFQKNAISFTMSKEELKDLFKQIEKVMKKGEKITYNAEHFAFETQNTNQALEKQVEELKLEIERLKSQVTELSKSEKLFKRLDRAVSSLGLSEKIEKQSQQLELQDVFLSEQSKNKKRCSYDKEI